MKQFETYEEIMKSSRNEVWYNTLIIGGVNEEAEAFYNLGSEFSEEDPECATEEMASLIESLSLHDFIIRISDSVKSEVMRIFKTVGYSPVAYYKSFNGSIYLFEK